MFLCEMEAHLLNYDNLANPLEGVSEHFGELLVGDYLTIGNVSAFNYVRGVVDDHEMTFPHMLHARY